MSQEQNHRTAKDTNTVQAINDRKDAQDEPVRRAVQAVRNSTPTYLFDMLEEVGLLPDMLNNFQERLQGRPLEEVSSDEMIRMGRLAVDATLGFETPTLATRFPAPLDNPDPHAARADQFMAEIHAIATAWGKGEIEPSEAAIKVVQTAAQHTEQGC